MVIGAKLFNINLNDEQESLYQKMKKMKKYNLFGDQIVGWGIELQSLAPILLAH